MTLVASTVEDVQEALSAGDGPVLLPVAGASKPGMSSSPDAQSTTLDVSALSGIVEYDPAELTFTARAATPVAEVSAALAEHGQYLPFDPPLAGAGATLGGAVAAGASGANAFRHGGVRDFVVGVRFVDGTGRLVGGGGKVVKNAAGFDFPKLMVGAMGRLGVMVQLSFKVFPRPAATTTLSCALGDTATALSVLTRVARGPVAVDALDLAPGGRLLVRLGGHPEALDARATRLSAELGGSVERIDGDDDATLWRAAAELDWRPPGSTLVRVALTAGRVAALDAAMADAGAPVRFSLGANVAWVAWPSDRGLDELDAALTGLGLAAVVVVGRASRPLLGARTGGAFAARVRGALDPFARFPEI